MLENESTPFVLRRAFLQSDILRKELLHWPYYRDVLCDINRLYSSRICRDSAPTPSDTMQVPHMKVTRSLWSNKVPTPTRTVRLNMKTNSISHSCYPLGEYSVILETVGREIFHFIARNRFVYWDFVKSLRNLYHRGASKRVTKAECVLYRQLHYAGGCDGDQGTRDGEYFRGKLTVVVHGSGREEYNCHVDPKTMRIVALHVDSNLEVFHVPVNDNIAFIHLGSEYEEYKPYDFVLKVISGKLPRDIIKITSGCEKIVPRTFVAINFTQQEYFATQPLRGYNPYWAETCHHRVRMSDLDPSLNKGHAYRNEAIGFHAHMLSVTAEKTVVVLGSQFIRYSDIYHPESVDTKCDATSIPEGCIPSVKFDKSFQLDSNLSLLIRIVHGENLVRPKLKRQLLVESMLLDTADSMLSGVDIINAVVSQVNDGRASYGAENHANTMMKRKTCVSLSFASTGGIVRHKYKTYW